MNSRIPRRRAACLLALTLAGTLLAGCLSLQTKPVAAPVTATGLAELMERPAERALIEGLRAYDDGQYEQAEAALRSALDHGLASPRDQASAHKLLAFITCTSERLAECEAAFRAARAADPAFMLNRSEAGHPLWGPVYRRIAGG
jgi:Tfp pilus assembly protein PilF